MASTRNRDRALLILTVAVAVAAHLRREPSAAAVAATHRVSTAGAAAAACNASSFRLLPNTDLNGGDLPGQPVSKALSTPAECAALCCAAAAAGCAGYSLNAGAAGARWCYLKAAGWSQGSSPGCDSGLLGPSPSANWPWFNLSIARVARRDALIAAMTLAEQISWLDNGVPAIPRLSLPAYDWEGEASHGVAWAGVSTVFPSPIAWGASFDPELVGEIGAVIATEARAKFADGMGADGGSAEFYGLSFMTPNNNLIIDPRWGRGQETNGEDPVLTSALTSALIHGLQDGDDPRYKKLVATSKHWLGYHLESWAGDAQYRLSHSFNYSDVDIAQYYVQPFAAAVSAGVAAVMCAYDGQNATSPAWPRPGGREPWGVPMCLHPNLQAMLRDRLGFQGYVISDEGSITFAGPGYHDFAPTVRDAACLAMNAGTDLALGGEFGPNLGDCVARGNVTSARVAQALARTLDAAFAVGWFDSVGARLAGTADPVHYNAVTVAGNVSTPAHRALARRAAAEGLVLLKNARATLPLRSAGLTKLALVGPAADYSNTSTGSYIGNYAGCTDGPGGPLTADPRCHVVTLRAALGAAAAAGGWALAYAPGCDVNTVNATGIPAAVAAAAGADAIVAAVGLDTCQETACSEGEAHDRMLGTLDLPGSQGALIAALRAAYPATPLVIVLMNGGAVSAPASFDAADAILEAWYGGQEAGAAVADALLGAASPAGRLPVTIVRDVSELPPYTDTGLATPPGRTHLFYTGAPLFPFGFGLSYATFTYSGIAVQPPALLSAAANATFTVTATLTHAGGAVSDEVVQLYGTYAGPAVGGAASVPRQQLLAFTRVRSLAPGSVTPVAFTLPAAALRLVPPAGGDPVVSAGVWTLSLGGGPPRNAEWPGGGAVLNSPGGVAAATLRRDRFLFIADTRNDAVRRVNVSTGAISTLVAAAAPTDVAAGRAGDVVYVAESGGHRVLRVYTESVDTVVLAGTGVAGFSGDGGPATLADLRAPFGVAIDTFAWRLVFSDRGNQRVRAVDLAAGTIATIAGTGVRGFGGDGGPATAAALSDPSGVAVTYYGSVVIADAGNHRVRIIAASTGEISTLAGTGAAGFSGDGGPATAAALHNPMRVAIALSAIGSEVLIVDAGNERVRAVSASGYIATAAGSGVDGFAGDGGAATAAALHTPSGIAADAYGAIYVADGGNERVRVLAVNASYVIYTTAGTGDAGAGGDFGPATAAELDAPGGVAVGMRGVNRALYVADTGNDAVRVVYLANGDIETAMSASAPADVAANADGTALVVAASGEHRILLFLTTDVNIYPIAGTGEAGDGGDGGPATAARLNAPAGVAFTDLRIVVADTGNHRVREFELAAPGIITTIAGTGVAGYSGDGGPGTAAALRNPSGVAITAAGDVVIADAGNHRVRIIAASTGEISTLAGTGAAGFSGDGGPATAAALHNPMRVALALNGDALVADASNHRVRAISAATGRIATVAGSGVDGFTGDGGAATAAAMRAPSGIAADAYGTVYVADGGDERVRVLALVALVSPPAAAGNASRPVRSVAGSDSEWA